MGCGVDTGRTNGRWCNDCRIPWQIITSPSSARYHVWKRDDGVCAGCGEFAGHLLNMPGTENTWQVDHVFPLWTAAGEIAFWGLCNLQTLCGLCHKAKNAKEAKQRAKEARCRVKFGGEPEPEQMRLPW
jgi:5-methylcytosine-specific restriction endonuclease McrA